MLLVPEDGEVDDAVLLGFVVVLVPVLLAVFDEEDADDGELADVVVDGLVLEDGEVDTLDEDEEALARSDLYVFSSLAIVFTKAFRFATSFLISERSKETRSFCSFFRSANDDWSDFKAALSAATAALFPDFSSARMSASSFRSMSRILSSLFRSR